MMQGVSASSKNSITLQLSLLHIADLNLTTLFLVSVLTLVVGAGMDRDVEREFFPNCCSKKNNSYDMTICRCAH